MPLAAGLITACRDNVGARKGWWVVQWKENDSNRGGGNGPALDGFGGPTSKGYPER